MINKSDMEFIRQTFKYAMLRMEELPAEVTWGSYKTKYKRIEEVQQKQGEILEKLVKLIN